MTVDKDLEFIAKKLQKECHQTVDFIMANASSKVNIQDATNVFIFRKLAELQLQINDLLQSLNK